MDERSIAAPGHTFAVFGDGYKSLVDRLVKKIALIRSVHPEIEAIAGCGHSALPLLGGLSYLTGLPMIAVRKRKDTKNDSSLANGWMGCKGYLILDDFISSGWTVDKIVNSISLEAKKRTKYAKDYSWTPESQSINYNPKPIAFLSYGGLDQCRTMLMWERKPLEIPYYCIAEKWADNLNFAGTWNGRPMYKNTRAYFRHTDKQRIQEEKRAAREERRRLHWPKPSESAKAPSPSLFSTIQKAVLMNPKPNPDADQIVFIGDTRPYPSEFLKWTNPPPDSSRRLGVGILKSTAVDVVYNLKDRK